VSNRGTSGTLSYMSPQQLLGKPPSASDDIYALGTTLYELLTGKPPFFRGDVAMQVLNAPVPTIAERRDELGIVAEGADLGIPPAWEETIAACLAKEPAGRPASAVEISERLRRKGAAGGLNVTHPAKVNREIPATQGGNAHKSQTAPEPDQPETAQAVPARHALMLVVSVALMVLVALIYYFGHHLPEQNRRAEIARLELAARAEANAAERQRLENEAARLRTEAETRAREQAARAAETRLAAERRASEIRALGKMYVVPDLKLDMLRVEPGSYTRGSPSDEPGRDSDETPHRVTITAPFFLGRTEVTMGQWKAVMGTDALDQVRLMLTDETLYNLGGKMQTFRDWMGASKDTDPKTRVGNIADDLPMAWVSWTEANLFCQRLTAKEQAAGRLPEGYAYTLPTEAQWEYAARAGTATATHAGPIEILGKHNAPILDRIAWYGGNSSIGYEGQGWNTATWEEKQYPGGNAGYRRVGTKDPNAWGFHDMLGNVWEWCADWYGAYPTGEAIDPTGPASGTDRVYRGGSWNNAAANCRSAFRGGDSPDYRGNNLGFRLALSSVP